jgi:hypothetical protein
MAPSPDPLDPLLDRWRSAREPAPLPQLLTRDVWRRIAAAEASPIEPGLIARIEAAFRRPSFAFTFIAACTLFGLFLAEIRVSQQQAQRNVQLAHAYIQLIDPLLGSTSGNVASPASITP